MSNELDDDGRDALNELCDAAERMLGAGNDLWLAQNPDERSELGPPLSEEEAQEHHHEAFQRLSRAVYYARKRCLGVNQPTVARGLFT